MTEPKEKWDDKNYKIKETKDNKITSLYFIPTRTNGNEKRLALANLRGSIYIGLCQPYFGEAVTYDMVTAQLWLALSSYIKARKSVGFPLVYDSRVYRNECFLKRYTHNSNVLELVNLYFEKTYCETSLKNTLILLTQKDIIFQKALILYTLWREGVSAATYRFNVVLIEDTNIVYKIGDLHFWFGKATNYIIVLDHKRTDLIKIAQDESVYLNMLYDEYEKYDFNSEFVKGSSFIDWFLRNYTNFLTSTVKSILKVQRNNITTSQITPFHGPGTLVQLNKDGVLSQGVIIKRHNVDSLDNKLFVAVLIAEDIFEILYVSVDDVFQQPSLLTRAFGYSIGY